MIRSCARHGYRVYNYEKNDFWCGCCNDNDCFGFDLCQCVWRMEKCSPPLCWNNSCGNSRCSLLWDSRMRLHGICPDYKWEGMAGSLLQTL